MMGRGSGCSARPPLSRLGRSQEPRGQTAVVRVDLVEEGVLPLDARGVVEVATAGFGLELISACTRAHPRQVRVPERM